MAKYLRHFLPGGTYFFTIVTHERRRILTTSNGRTNLRQAFLKVQQKRPFHILALVLMPDHLNTVWTLPPGDQSYSIRWAQIKEHFSRSFQDTGGQEGGLTRSRTRHRERAVWQRRFWKHTCRDEDDLKRCVDYLHWNPVKHRVVPAVSEYPWSSFHRFVRGLSTNLVGAVVL